MLAPVVEIAQSVRQSSEDKTVYPSEDSTNAERGPTAETSPPPSQSSCTRAFGENCDFPAENGEAGEVHADKNIRVGPPDYKPLDVPPWEFLSAFYPDPHEDVRL